ncbi:hypothetical protein J2Z83_002423 [Virgibacillus natechei]|uniref:Uncharacterized protein n=1 Tax=Virgibacillus natechei TaxID=1216297 RepID=A0ABS4IHA9_9BACI|nr:hypothetical protein [Virgibacillus natechei]MBP1970305.1 hypothetical protein [Virgibacillus natechei]UZD13132.1 hypothetical protein OLD84_00710 [Virgibacillus natechei]
MNTIDYDYHTLLTKFKPKIKKSLNQTDYQKREELEQELKLKLYEKMPVIQNLEAPGLIEFLGLINFDK